MNFKRRDFLRMGTAGIAGTVLAGGPALAQEKEKEKHGNPDTNAEFKGGSGSLDLTLKLKPGTFDLRLDNFSRGTEKVVIMDGTFQAPNAPKVSLHRSYFCAEGGDEIFARLGDDGQWTSLLWSPSDKKGVASLTVWNGMARPKTFGIETSKIRTKATPQEYVVEGNSSDLDLKGHRTPPPPVSLEDLANAVDNNPDYLEFTRGKGLTRRHAAAAEIGCVFLALLVPGGELFYAFWDGGQ